MSGYIGNIPTPQATQTRDVFTATASQTSFATSGYTPGFVDVWLNGVKLVNGDDFTATNGSDVVLTVGAASGDTVEVLSFSTFEVNSQTFTGGLTVNNDGATVITADRATSDGTLVDFKKDGVSRGVIGVSGGTVYVNGVNGKGLGFYNNLIVPTDGTALTNGAADIGTSSYRFKDLYLSGGAYLGGTGAANLLDDYEEGAWSPYWSDISGNAIFNAAPAASSARYTKVGDTVHANCYFAMPPSFGATGSYVASGVVCVGGLPFTSNRAGSLDYAGAAVGWYDSFAGYGAGYSPMMYVESGTTVMPLVYANGVGMAIVSQVVAYNAGSGLIFSVSYKTAS